MLPKRRFSEFPCEPGCNQKYACGLEQAFDDEAEPVVAQAEALVLQQPGVGALDRPAPLAQAGAVRLAALVEAGFRAVAAAHLAVGFGVVALVGKRRPDPEAVLHGSEVWAQLAQPRL